MRLVWRFGFGFARLDDREHFVGRLAPLLGDDDARQLIGHDAGGAVVCDNGVDDVDIRPGFELADCAAKTLIVADLVGHRAAVSCLQRLAHSKTVAFGHVAEEELGRTVARSDETAARIPDYRLAGMGADDVGTDG